MSPRRSQARIGVKLPRHVTSFISSLAPVGAAMEAAFPFLAIIVAATVLIEHFSKLREAADKLDGDTAKFGVTVNTTFTSLDDKLLQAQIKADELAGNHLGALKKELELIDHASMKDIMQTFDQLAKAVDAVFADLKSHWYTFGSGAEGAKHSLAEFKNEYDLLMSKALAGDKDAATHAANLLKNKLDREKQMLADMRTALEYESHSGESGGTEEKTNAYMAARVRLSQAGAGYAKDEVTAEAELVDLLEAETRARKLSGDIAKQEKDNARIATSNKLGNEAFKRFKEEERVRQEEEKDRDEANKLAIKNIQDTEKDKIAATKEGTVARLAAIDAAINEENHKGLQETEYYKELGRQRIELVRHMADEEARVRAEAAKIAADHDMRMAALGAAAEMEQIKHRQAMRKKTDQDDINAEIATANEEYKIKQRAYEKEKAALDKNDKDYQNRLKSIQNKEEELTQQHEDKITEIKDKAEEKRNDRILAAERQFENALAQGLTNVLMRQESFSKMMLDLGDQVVSGMLKNALMSMMTADMTKEKDAAHAARKGYNAGLDFPFPVNIVMAPLLGASAFAAVMAFNRGGLVPGSGNGDIIPAMLTPGERVLTVQENQMLSKGSSGSGFNGGAQHITYAPTVHVPPGGSPKEFEKFIDQHFDRWARSQSRRKGVRLN